jgi:superfamily II DNA or RNA helicase
MVVKIIHVDNRLAKIICDKSLLTRIRNFFSYRQTTWKNKRKTSYIEYLFNISGIFKKGLIPLLQEYLNVNNIVHTVEYSYERKIVPIEEDKIWFPKNKEPFDYQLKAVLRSLKRERGLWDLATSSGKSLTACMFIQSFLNHHDGSKAMFVVNDTNLLYQAQKDFIEYGTDPDDITLWGDFNVPDFNKKILIVISKSLISNFEFSYSFTKDRTLLFCDEVDLVANPKTQIHKFIDNHSSEFRFGCTGTIPSDIYLKHKLISNFGDIIIKKSAEELRTTGVLTSCEVLPFMVFHDEKSKETLSWEEEFDYICNSNERNKLLLDIAISLKTNTLLLVDRISQIEYIESISKDISDKEIFFMRGDIRSEQRKEILDKMETINNGIVVSISTLFSRGVSVKNIHNVICSSLGKSESRIIQTIGRGLRKHKTKNKALIIDVFDNLKYSKKHWNSRKEVYASENIPILYQKTFDINI